MSLTPTKAVAVGFKAPNFTLPDSRTGNAVSFKDIKGDNGTLVMFICNHCPYVKHAIQELVKIGSEYIPKGIGIVAINSNDIVKYPNDHPDKMKMLAEELNFPFPYLFDESQKTAKAIDAAYTPDFNLFDVNNKCIYRGQLDSSRPSNNVPVKGADLRKSLDQVLNGEQVPLEQTPSIGCNIKWKE